MYIYAAECYCDDCAKDIKKRILKETGKKASDFRDETTFDSDEYPKGPSDDGASSDGPEHCASGEDCLDPTEINGEKYGHFFENDLTEAGVENLKEHIRQGGPVAEFWKEHYSQYYDLD